MALDIATPFASGDPVTFNTANPDLTGATGSFTTVVTGGASGSVVTSIVFRALTSTKRGTLIHIYWNDAGTRRNVGSVTIPPNLQPNGQVVPFEVTWICKRGFLLNGDKYDVAPQDGDCVYVSYAVGGDL